MTESREGGGRRRCGAWRGSVVAVNEGLGEGVGVGGVFWHEEYSRMTNDK